MLGLTIFAQQFPSFLLSLYGGFIADRYNRHKILLLTQAASMVQATLLAILILSNHYTISEILCLSILLGIINAFDVPARQPLVHELVSDKDELPNAMALNSAMVNLARLLGPALSGIILQQFGAGICFLLNAISFLAVIVSLLVMKLPPFQPPVLKKKAILEMAEGFRYLKQTPILGSVILLLALVSLMVLPYDTLVPVFAKMIFNGDAATYGYISSFMGLGAISGTFFLASLKKGTNLKNFLPVSGFALGAGLILFSHTTYFPLAMTFAIISGFGAMAQNTLCITIIQVHAAQNMRGRMMSYVALAYFGMLPLGSLLIGSISQQIGAPNTMLCQGIAAFVIAIVFSRYMRKEKVSKEGVNEEELEEIEDEIIEKI